MAAPSSTLYIKNMPPGVNDELVAAAFGQQPGFSGARLRTRRTGESFAFVEFVDPGAAAAAFSRFQGYRFAPSDAVGITVEYAKDSRPGPSAPRGHHPEQLARPAAAGPPPAMQGGYGRGPPPAPAYGQGGQAPPPYHAHGAPPPSVGGYGREYGAPPPSYGRHPVPPSPVMSGGHGQYQATPPHAGPYGRREPPPMPVAPPPPMPARAPPGATSTLYVEGVPDDASERELAHLFRPFDGFEALRLVPHSAKTGRKIYLCFAEFRSPGEAAAACAVINGYDLDPRDPASRRLRISYARKPPRPRSDGRAPRDYAMDVEADARRRRPIHEVEATDSTRGGHGTPASSGKAAARGGGTSSSAPANAPGAASSAGTMPPKGTRREEDLPAWARKAKARDSAPTDPEPSSAPAGDAPEKDDSSSHPTDEAPPPGTAGGAVVRDADEEDGQVERPE